MVKKVNKVQNNAQNNVQNQQVNNNDCQHVQLGGMAYYDAKQYFLFSPQESGVNKVPRFRSMGVAQQMPDGTFDFVVQHRLRTQSELIKKLAHGRVSKTTPMVLTNYSNVLRLKASNRLGVLTKMVTLFAQTRLISSLIYIYL